MTYLLNTWYPAAWAHELTDGILARTYLDTPVMMYRTSGGEVIAMHDRCPHRFAPLSYGRIEDDKAVCIYHGLEFDRTGQCVGTQLCFENAPKVARVRTFPIVEQDNILWIWMGDAEAADPALVPRFHYHNDPEYRVTYGYKYTRCDYRLLNDNLMDLSHIVLLHPVFQARDRKQTFKAWEEGDDVVATYLAVEEDQEFHTANTIRWIAPSATDLEMHIIPEYGRGEQIVEWSANLMIPETPTTCHYFWSVAIDRNSPESNEDVLQRMQTVVDVEDAWMLEGVQNRMGAADLWDLDPILLRTDAAAVRARRKLAKLIAAEVKEREEKGAQANPDLGRLADKDVAVLDRVVGAVPK